MVTYFWRSLWPRILSGELTSMKNINLLVLLKYLKMEVWLGQKDQRHQICRKGFQNRKRLFTVFLNFQSSVAVDILPASTTAIGSYYAETVLPNVAQEISSQRPNSGIQNVLLLHDNASPHKARAVTQIFRREQNSSFASPALQPRPRPLWLLAIPYLEGQTRWKEV